MIIEFQTKADSNKQRLDNFLRLTRPVRFLKFLQMMDDFSIFPFTKTNNPHFKIEINMNFNETWGEKVKQFLKLAEKHSVRMILVGGGAVNFHGYQRHSADVDFWIDTLHLIESKLKSQRPKDLLDVQELIRIRKT